jgi:hypothetical protein
MSDIVSGIGVIAILLVIVVGPMVISEWLKQRRFLNAWQAEQARVHADQTAAQKESFVTHQESVAIQRSLAERYAQWWAADLEARQQLLKVMEAQVAGSGASTSLSGSSPSEWRPSEVRRARVFKYRRPQRISVFA